VLLYRVPSSSSPAKGLYNPKAFVTHAASLDQGCPHCPRFPTAASRRSLGRVSVPVWLIVLSDQLPITGLVGRYPTNYLIGRGPIPGRLSFGSFSLDPERHRVLAAVSRGCPQAQGRCPRVTHPSATRTTPEGMIPVRLACVRRAASVRSEPGSNSQLHPSPTSTDPTEATAVPCRTPPPGQENPPRRGHPGLGITWPRPGGLPPAEAHPSGHRPPGLKGNDQVPRARRPRTPPDSKPGAAQRPASPNKPRHPRDARNRATLQKGRRPRIPSCLSTLSNNKRRGDDPGFPASAPRRRDPLYRQFALAAQGSFCGNWIR
jgi:hypothetical protein